MRAIALSGCETSNLSMRMSNPEFTALSPYAEAFRGPTVFAVSCLSVGPQRSMSETTIIFLIVFIIVSDMDLCADQSKVHSLNILYLDCGLNILH